MVKMFFAYPAEPPQLTQTIEKAVAEINRTGEKVKTWRALNIVGRFIEATIIDEISDHVFVADITILNFNVIYEIGYAIGQGRKILLVRNRSLEEAQPTILQLGIFDTIGYVEYVNSDDLIVALQKQKPNNPTSGHTPNNRSTPVYIVDSKYKDDFSISILARVKKARLGFRSFDPNESTRLSALDAISQVSQSTGILLSLLPKTSKESKIHNFRSAFVAGLANGMNKIVLILQNGSDSVPVDLRDYAVNCYKAEDVAGPIAEFAMEVVDAFQTDETFISNRITTDLEKLNLGASAAENEMRTLHFYYLKTDGYYRAMRGEVQLVVGRKGSGKTAIFIQLRDAERQKTRNVVLDLMPEGYQLIKFKEHVLDYLEEGTRQHTITGFWEYILLLEICHKILETDKKRHYSDQTLFNQYEKLEKLYSSEEYVTEGDFSERMSRLLDSIAEAYEKKFAGQKNVRLSDPEITGLLYRSNIKALRDTLLAYLNSKNKIWLLFDNIDKGWPTTGLQHADLIIIRSLLDAAKKIQRFFGRHSIDVFPVIFLRIDVYDLLVNISSDRQKEAKVQLDWTDPDLLREVILLRVLTNRDIDNKEDKDALWRHICVSHFKGEESLNYLIDRSLLRPRFLLNLITHCRSFAVNLAHSKIKEEDIEKGLQAYSHDLIQDIKLEIQDIYPEAAEVLQEFIAGKSEMLFTDLKKVIQLKLLNNSIVEKVVELLLWYGFIGVAIEHDIKYIYSLNNDIDSLKALIRKMGDDAIAVINPAFWPGLLIQDH